MTSVKNLTIKELKIIIELRNVGGHENMFRQ